MSDGNSGKGDGSASALQRVDLGKTSIRAVQSERPRPIVVVLGMHRSGTSLLSNILHLLGVDMADTNDRVNEKNAGGFWERPDMFRLQDEVLAAIGRPIGQPSHVLPFPAAWWRRKEVQALKPKLVAYLREQLEKSANPWGFKDPRTCRLLPLWWEVFRELNVEPLYVHAIRSPVESAVSMAEQSQARKISNATGELMWLSYNYDIIRHVTIKQPPILVDYDEWFEDPLGTARRLVDALGIGGDLSLEEFEECVRETVRADYRHQNHGKEKAEATIPIAEMMYRSLVGEEKHDSVDLRQLRSQVRLADLFFKSVRPVVENLDAAVAAEGHEKELLAERDAVIAENEHRFAKLQEEHERAVEQLKQLQEERQGYQERLKHLDEERQGYEKRLNQLEEAHRSSQEQLTQLQDEHRRTIDEAASARGSAAAAEERAKESEEERKRALEDAATALHAAGLAEKLARDAGETAREREVERDDIRAVLEERERELAQSKDELRDERRNALALSKRLQARERELADARAAAVPQETGASIFAWPSGGVAAGEVTASVESDARGIRGSVVFVDRPDLVPVIEVRIERQLVAAQFCTHGSPTSGEGWLFDIPWSRIAEEHEGKEAIVKVAGLEREIARVAIPDDLHDYHVAPAMLASTLLGGTVAEASEYHRWILEAESHRDVEMARSYYSDAKTDWPIITVVIFGGDGETAAATVQSLRDQVYRDWEAIVVGKLAETVPPDTRVRTLAKREFGATLRDYAADALFTFVEAGDTLSQTALLHLATAAQQTPEFSLIYSDEDRIEPRSGVRGFPHMKGEWSPDLALASDYVTRLALVRRSEIGDLKQPDRAAVYNVALRVGLSGQGPIIHLPFVLYHRSARNVRDEHDLAQVVEAVVPELPTTADARVVRLPRGRWKIEWPLPDPLPTVSLVVPTRDRVDLLRVCVEGFLDNTNYDNLEVLIADNDSEEEETKSYLREISTRPRVRVIPCPGPFNFSRINNLAVEHANGSVIGLMNNDLKVLDPDWLRHMVAHVVRPDVGIVGAKLLHADDSVQHAGVTLGIGVASHLYKSFPRDAEGHHGRLVLAQDLSAVTAACLLIRRNVWDEVGGLDEIFPIAYNDVDLCLKVTAHGYRVLWTPEAVVYHLESQSRGKETTPEKRERLEQEKTQLVERWGDRVSRDPFYSPNLSAKAVDARLAFPPRTTPPWRPLAA
jgi:GT2 family glycosyltransferase